MAARTKGWAQLRVSNTGSNGQLNASTDTTIDPDVAGGPVASDRADGSVFLVAGVPVNIRWGGFDSDGASSCFGAFGPNTAAWRCDVLADTSQTSVANDTFTASGAGGGGCDRTFSFTPTVTGTYRLRVSIVVTVTVGGAAVSDDNTDNGNFGSEPPSRIAGTTLQSFTPGLLAVGTVLSSVTRSIAAALVRFNQTVAHTFNFAVGSGTNASSSCTVTYNDSDGAVGLGTVFATRTIAATTSANKADSGVAVDNTLPAAQRTLTDVSVTLAFENSALSTALSGAGIPWSFISGALPSGWSQVMGDSYGATMIGVTDAFQIDPRIDFADKVLQLNDTAFGTPPSSKNVANGQRPVSKLASIAARAKHRGADADPGLNGINYTEKLWDAGNLISSEASPWKTQACSSQAQGGQNGWANVFLNWDAQLPAGTWTQKEVITSPANAVGLEMNNTRSLVLLARDPNFVVVPAAGLNSSDLDHFRPGKPWITGGVLINYVDLTFPTVDVSPAPYALIGRFNLALARIEILNDVAGTPTWQSAAATVGTWTKWPLTQSPGDANAWIVTFTGTQTTGWAYAPVTFPVIYNNGTPYGQPVDSELLGKSNFHHKWHALREALGG